MSSLTHTHRYASQCQLHRIQSKIHDFDAVASPFPGFHSAHISEPAERRFERKICKISSPSPLDVYPCYQKLLGPVGAPANGIVSKTLGSDGATDASLDMTTTLR